MSIAAADAWSAAAPASIVENLYGPTELTICCASYRYNPEAARSIVSGDTIPIGRVYEGLQFAILDREGRPASDGAIGELYIAGPQNFRGYWHDPERSLAAHVLAAEADGTVRLYYRTGDHVRRLRSGDLEFVGRVDDQVKVRGYRVELGEVERAIRAHRGVVDAAVLPWPVVEGIADGLVAFVTGQAVDPGDLGDTLRERLPAYMVPGQVRLLDELPKNTNGKVDRATLRTKLSPS